MTVTKRHALEVLQDPVSNNVVNEPVGDTYESDRYGGMVLDGTEALNVSHAGGEFQELTRGLLGDFWTSTSEKVWGKCLDYCTFQDRSTKQTAAFSVQVGVMAEAYMAWSLKQRGAGGKGFFDLDEQHTQEEQQRKCDGMDTKLLSVLVLDVFFLAFISNLVHHALQHDQPDWQLKHGCPTCTYRLQDELVMILDGDMDDAATSLPTSEHTFYHEQYLTHEFVDEFASNWQADHSLIDKDGDSNLCAEHWKNMKDSTTQKMWNVFDESGVFITVCQHGFCLLITDMVQSGEQSKYVLVVTLKLLDAFGSDLRGRYDIGCQFKTTLASSVLKTLQIEYWQWLVNLATSRQELETILSIWMVITAQNVAPIWSDNSVTRKRETMHCHAQENYEKDLKAVQELEDHLGVMCHWVPEDEEWQAAAHLVSNQKYQHALDNMNQSGTGDQWGHLGRGGRGKKFYPGSPCQTKLLAIFTFPNADECQDPAGIGRGNSAGMNFGNLLRDLWCWEHTLLTVMPQTPEVAEIS
ncbi:hypothetical protein F5141DRAFT_1059245 [Pisolithus sp. B1]|nr:hypothetical protein F5141DRAFT_1059245 [Pisolithus sp. B1]